MLIAFSHLRDSVALHSATVCYSLFFPHLYPKPLKARGQGTHLTNSINLKMIWPPKHQIKFHYWGT